jgi:predicted ATP-grasp superfamily ATP-dependent carboligase
MLAQSARRAGWRPWVLDLYGDEDTRACSWHCQRVDDGRGGFDSAAVLAGLRRAAAEGAAGWVYGSGWECRPGELAELAVILPLWGNGPELLRWLKSPARFFALLDALDIPYPESRFQVPEFPEGWLVKPGCGEGGKRVALCAAAAAIKPSAYFQRCIAGQPQSVLFLADGRRAVPLGFNTLWTAGTVEQPYGFAGACNRADLPPPWRERLAAWLQRLVEQTGLKGLNSLDFIYDGACCWVLEVNPRPSASMALYDEDFSGGLLAAHVAACAGRLPQAVPPAMPRAMRIVFAPYPLQVPAGVAWPEGCADLPAPGSVLAAGQPLCTVAAAGQAAVQRLQERGRAALACCRPLQSGAGGLNNN